VAGRSAGPGRLRMMVQAAAIHHGSGTSHRPTNPYTSHGQWETLPVRATWRPNTARPRVALQSRRGP